MTRYTLAQFVFRGYTDGYTHHRPHVAYIVLSDEDYDSAMRAFNGDGPNRLQFKDAREGHKPLVVDVNCLAGIHAGETLDSPSDFTLQRWENR